MSIRIDDCAVKTTPAPDKSAIRLWDADVASFGLRIFAPTTKRR